MAERHHYISQFHLRGFLDPKSTHTSDPWFWVGDCLQGTIVRRSPKNTGWQRGMFDGPGAFANPDLSLESFLSKEVEGPAATALRNWVLLPQGKRGSIPPEVFRYVTWAAARSLPMLQLFEDWTNALPPDAQCVYPPPPGFEKIQWGGGVHCMWHPTLGIRQDVPSEQVHALRGQGWQVRMGKDDFLPAVHFQAWYFQVQMFPLLQWGILDAPPGQYFIIADRPVVWGVRLWGEEGWKLAVDVPPYYLRDPKVQLVAPLTRSVALFAFHRSSLPPVMVRPDDVNRIVACGARHWIAGPTKATVAAALEHDRVL